MKKNDMKIRKKGKVTKDRLQLLLISIKLEVKLHYLKYSVI